MAGIVDVVKQSTSSSNTLVGLLRNPIFNDLQHALKNDLQRVGVPFTLMLGEENNDAVTPRNEDLLVEEATLQAEFKQLSPLRNLQVVQLEKFYNTQNVALVTQRSDAISRIQMAAEGPEQLHAEMQYVTSYFDRQQSHLIKRVSQSLQLLKHTLPADSMVTCMQQKPKSRLLNSKAVSIMSDWYNRNISHPYPSDLEKKRMAASGNITVAQVKAWFANKRNRSLNTKPKRQQFQLQQQLKNICRKFTKPSDDYELDAMKTYKYAVEDLATLVPLEVGSLTDSTSIVF